MAIEVQRSRLREGGIEVSYYMDATVKSLQKKYDLSQIIEPEAGTKDTIESNLWPFLLTAKATGAVWGFDFEGYRLAVDYWKDEAKYASIMQNISQRVEREADLDCLIKHNLLRRELYTDKRTKESIYIYFPTEKALEEAGAQRIHSGFYKFAKSLYNGICSCFSRIRSYSRKRKARHAKPKGSLQLTMELPKSDVPQDTGPKKRRGLYRVLMGARRAPYSFYDR